MNRDMVMSYPDVLPATGDLIGGQWNPYIMANSGETTRESDDIVGTAGIPVSYLQTLCSHDLVCLSEETGLETYRFIGRHLAE